MTHSAAGRAGGAGGGEHRMVPKATPTSYYGRPVLKTPTWKWEIPAYFFTGGLAAGSSVLGYGADRSGQSTLRRRARLTSVAAVAVSGALLVEDLGRPSRFYNMLRVVKVTSPMSMGTWIFSAFAVGASTAAVSEVLPLPRGLGSKGGALAALTAPALATYTAVLLADTALPAWHGARSTLPFVFAGGAMASAGGVASALTPSAESGPARRLAVLGAVLELSSAEALRRGLDPAVRPAYDLGRAGRLGRAARALTAAGAAALVLGGRRRRVVVLAGGFLAAGAACERACVFEAGVASAEDPAMTVGPQRARLDRDGPSSVTAPRAASE